ncbi:hypothetical protein CVT24_011047 [Panaeolus cyanescens]|uniref:F-box domain-containing protein n=1 Tax=Panaeolus cyanescens TaxID=181874 RepID=A0A409VFW9_9AGAR|nr:hypothetical protein CVT24_011047 [Panaeolus cyanescens]
MLPAPEHIMPATKRLPIELIHLIIDLLAENNNSFVTDLKACSLVAKSWVPICRLYLFKKVEIGSSISKPHQPLDRYRQLTALVSQNQGFAKFLRNIRFTSIATADDEAEAEPLDNPSFTLSQMSEVRRLAIAAEECYQPETTHFGWCYILDWYLSTRQLTSLSLRGTNDIPLLPILSSPHLTTLQVDYSRLSDGEYLLSQILAQRHPLALEVLKLGSVKCFPLSLLGLCPNLRTMSLYSVSFIGSDNIKFPIAFPRLTSLKIGSIEGWNLRDGTISATGGNLGFPAVTSVEVYCPLKNLPPVQTMECLTLFYEEDHYEKDQIDWSKLSRLINDSLHHLTHISLDIHAETEAESAFRNIQQVLSSCKGSNVLEYFELYLQEWLMEPESWWGTSQAAWKGLSDALSSASDFPKLKIASFSLCLECYNEKYIGILNIFTLEDFQNILSDALESLICIKCAERNGQALWNILEEKGREDFWGILQRQMEALAERNGIEVHYKVDVFSQIPEDEDATPRNAVPLTGEKLPKELIHLIIDLLVEDNDAFVSNLKACSLVAKSWASVCRSCIFKEIEIGPSLSVPHSMDRYQQLAVLIKKNQDIAKFIQNIRFTTCSTVDEHDVVKSLDDPFSALSQMSEVRRLHITIINKCRQYQPGTLYFGWRHILDRYLSTQQLTTISLIGMNEVPILTILSSPQLKSLEINDCDLAGVQAILSTPLADRPRFVLETLKAEWVTNFSFALFSLCSNLRDMVIQCVSHQDGNLDSEAGGGLGTDKDVVFSTVTSVKLRGSLDVIPQFRTLQRFTMTYNLSDDELVWKDLSRLVNDSLHHLTHICLEIEAESEAKLVFDGIQEVLSSCRRDNVLVSFKISLNEWLTDLKDWWDPEASHDAWKRLGDTFSSASDFPYLKNTSIFLVLEIADGEDTVISDTLETKGCHDFRGILSGPLEALMNRKDVEVYYEPYMLAPPEHVASAGDKLPMELVHLIIDHLGEGNNSFMSDLKACSLVAKSWVPPDSQHVSAVGRLVKPMPVDAWHCLLSPQLVRYSLTIYMLPPLEHGVPAGERLPMELIQLIIDLLGEDKNSSVTDLKACSLVARSWVPICRSYLFKEVEIGTSSSGPHRFLDRYQQLTALVKQNQGFAKFLRDIHFSSFWTPDEKAAADGLDDPFFTLSQMSNVRRLSISSETEQGRYQPGTLYFGWRYVLDWYLSTKQLAEISLTGIDDIPLLSILSCPHLTDLQVDSCHLESDLDDAMSQLLTQGPLALEILKANCVAGIPLRLLSLCPNLRTMELYSVGFIGSDSIKASIAFPHLTSLEIGSIEGWNMRDGTLSAAGEILGFPAVTSVKVYCPLEPQDFPRVQTMERLNLVYDHEEGFDFQSNMIKISRLVNDSHHHLAHMSLDIRTETHAQSILRNLQQLLDSCKGDNVLQSFKIKLQEWLMRPQSWWDTSQAAWKGLSDVLSSASDFPNLKNASFSLVLECTDEDYANISNILSENGCSDVKNILAGALEGLIDQLHRECIDQTGMPVSEGDEDDAVLSLLFELPKVHILAIKFVTMLELYRDNIATGRFGWCYLLDRYLSTNQLTTISLGGVADVPLLSILSSTQLVTLNIRSCIVSDFTTSFPSLLAKKVHFTLRNLTAKFVSGLQLRLFYLCPNLETMALQYLDSTNDNPPFPLTFPCLTSLNVSGAYGHSQLLRPGMIPDSSIFPAVTSLTIDTPHESLPRFCILQKISLSVQTFEDIFDWNELSQLMKDSLLSLTDMHLEIHADAKTDASLQHLQEVLSEFKTYNFIRSFELVAHESLEGIRDWWDFASYNEWKELGDMLAINSNFPHLKRASFTFRLGITQKDGANLETVIEEKGYGKDMKDILRRPLEALIARNDVEVHYEVGIIE